MSSINSLMPRVETDEPAVKIPKPTGAADETDETESEVELPQTLIRIPVQQARPS